ncbi:MULTISPECIES: hypothetical protein [Pseudacidovorax]|uniref:Uncharacterized protein n=1 Tax=Pseudacidovorax intermedius TaxID=433924 RepID=A0A370FMB9_9BURK|nr:MULTISPECIES: hypothetical protein [Pseudacidovorax]RDI26016.1 hypothetical protein DFR41_103172 [Pseudacidovorax intermedius]
MTQAQDPSQDVAAQGATPTSSPQRETSRQDKASPGTHYKDEPEVTQEESVPLDGKDPVGEKMMEKLGDERRQQQEDRQ